MTDAEARAAAINRIAVAIVREKFAVGESESWQSVGSRIAAAAVDTALEEHHCNGCDTPPTDYEEAWIWAAIFDSGPGRK